MLRETQPFFDVFFCIIRLNASIPLSPTGLWSGPEAWLSWAIGATVYEAGRPTGRARLGLARTGSRRAARLAASFSDTDDIFLSPGRWARVFWEDGSWELVREFLRALWWTRLALVNWWMDGWRSGIGEKDKGKTYLGSTMRPSICLFL